MMRRDSFRVILISTFIFCIDQLLKFIARHFAASSWYFIYPYLGWEYFKNTGIAFSLPFPSWIILSITPPIIMLLFLYAKNEPILFSVFFGALSNYIDRFLFQGTIDYIRVFTGVINIADIMIAAGIIVLLIKNHTSLRPPSYHGTT